MGEKKTETPQMIYSLSPSFHIHSHAHTLARMLFLHIDGDRARARDSQILLYVRQIPYNGGFVFCGKHEIQISQFFFIVHAFGRSLSLLLLPFFL